VLRKRASSVKQGILILDEATSNLDASSEAAIHEKIREEFEDDTVISVAHRLGTLSDMDTIILLEKGNSQKLDRPLKWFVRHRRLIFRVDAFSIMGIDRDLHVRGMNYRLCSQSY